MEGGSIENRTVVVDNNPLFETESDVILCLYKPDMGSGYNTKGDYYYLRGISQGVFDIQNDKLICKHDGSTITNDKFKQMLRDHSSDEDYSLKSEFQNNMLQNLESGFINEKEYDQFLKEINQYAEIK